MTDLQSCNVIAGLLKFDNGGNDVHCIGVVISGRPLVFTDSQLSDIDAFVFSGYPGAEAGGIADVLFGDVPFTAKLPFTWPKSFDDIGSLADGRFNFDDGLTL
jgi:beta-glucosidase